jgi:glutamine synthetase
VSEGPLAGVPAGELVAVCCADLSGLVRGRALAAADLVRGWERGVGWVPADQAITAFGPLAEDNPWDSSGDLRIVPDAAARFRVTGPDRPPLHFALGDLVETDGTPWEGCLRTFLKEAVRDLEEAGLSCRASFEQEFQLAAGTGHIPPGFSLRALRAAEPFPTALHRALAEAGCAPECVLPEYGPDQFEVTVRPAGAVPAADRAAAVREVVRDVAAAHGRPATFAPILDPASVGNGVHVHLSLWDRDGRPVTLAAGEPLDLSADARAFAAGVMAHLPALVALTAPSVSSYHRLTPHRWSAGYACLGRRNREAALRIAPVTTIGGGDPAAQANLEYRPADATACPHLVLGALLRAGLDGLRRGLEPPAPVDVDPATLSEEERSARGVRPLPGSLDEALKELEADAVVRGWFPDTLWRCLVSMKRTELALMEGLTDAEVCQSYARVH